MKKSPLSTFRVLALHGGGIHGVATAAYLADIEERTDAPLHRHFDLITGTSTGGLIALALSLGISAFDIQQLYQERGLTIFKRRLAVLPKRLAMLVGPIYCSTPFHEQLQRILGPDTRLADAKCRLCIPAVNIRTGDAVVFKTRHHRDFERDHQLRMWRVAAATAAAPIFFRPVRIPGRGWFVDGGLWANSPIEVGVAEGLKLGARLDEIEVLSIGTGTQAFHKAGNSNGLFRHARHGLIGWGRMLVHLVMRTQVQRAKNLTNYLLPESHLRHIDFDLPEESGGLDAVHQATMFAERAQAQAKWTACDVREQFFSDVTERFSPVP